MKTQIIFLIAILTSLNITFSQQRELGEIYEAQVFMSRKQLSNKNIEGSIYINENFQPVKLINFDNKIYQGRYDAYTNNIEIKLNEDKIIYLGTNQNIDVLFINDNKLYRAYDYKNKESQNEKSYLLVLNEFKHIDLLKLETIVFTEKKPAASSYEREIPAHFSRNNDSYFIVLNNKLISIPTRKKDFLKTFPKYRSELKTYMKKESLNPKKEEELVQIIKYLDKIIK